MSFEHCRGEVVDATAYELEYGEMYAEFLEGVAAGGKGLSGDFSEPLSDP